MTVNETLNKLLTLYGDGGAGNAPTKAQWQRVVERDPDHPFALVNFFKFNKVANYQNGSAGNVSGDVAFQRYADVSIPSMQKAGGEFLLVAPFAGSLLGEDQDWDLVAIGKYPKLQAFLDLYLNPDYVDAFAHRVAAVERQTVLITEL